MNTTRTGHISEFVKRLAMNRDIMGMSSKPTHLGHRARIKEKYEKSGLHGWHDYEVLERTGIVIFYCS